jgi:signal transduction histidine kinase
MQINNNLSLIRQRLNINNKIPSKPLFIKADKVSFSGKSDIKLPTEKVEEVITKSLTEIHKEDNPKLKAGILEGAILEITKIHRNFISQIAENSPVDKKYEVFFEDLEHEVFKNAQVLSSRSEEDIPPNFDRICDEKFLAIINAYKRYQLMLDEGLESNKHKPIHILQLAMESVNDKAKEKKINVTIKGQDLLERPDTVVRLSNYNLYTVFVNILQNAVKYTPDNGKVLVEISKGKIDKGFPVLNFSVMDSGIGIPPEEQKELLALGLRASNAIASGIPGTGYGFTVFAVS